MRFLARQGIQFLITNYKYEPQNFGQYKIVYAKFIIWHLPWRFALNKVFGHDLLPHHFPSWVSYSYLKRFCWLEIENKEGIIIGQLPLKYFCILPQRSPKVTLLGARAPALCHHTQPDRLCSILPFSSRVGGSWEDNWGVGFSEGSKAVGKKEGKRFAPT